MKYIVSNTTTTNTLTHDGRLCSSSKFELNIDGIDDKFVIVYDIRDSSKKDNPEHYEIYLNDDIGRYVHGHMYSKKTYDKLHKLVNTLVKSLIKTKPL